MAASSLAGLLSNVLLFLLIGGMAGSCDAGLLRSKFTTSNGFRGIMAGLACQFVLLPLLGFLALLLFPQPPATAISLLIVTTSPGGGFSGFWCFAANADLALSVAMTTASTIVSMIALPLNVLLYITLLYGRSVDVNLPALLSGCAIVISGVFSGYSISRRYPGLRQPVSSFGQAAGVALMVVGALTNGRSRQPVWTNEASWFAAISVPVIGGLSIAMLIAVAVRLPRPQAVAVAIECCYQNTGLALTIALSAMDAADVGRASGVPLLYGLVEIAVIPVFALAAWRLGWTYAPKSENCVVALVGNYQPTSEDSAALA